MRNIKEAIIDSAMELLELIDMCDDETFVEDVTGAVYYDDIKALRYIRDELDT